MKQKHTNKHKSIYALWNNPSVTKPNPQNSKNCSSKCAYDCAQLQYTIQHKTVLLISPLTTISVGLTASTVASMGLRKWSLTTDRPQRYAVVQLCCKVFKSSLTWSQTPGMAVNLHSDSGSVDTKLVHRRVPWCADLLTEVRSASGRTFYVFTPRICISPHLHQSVIRRYDNCVSNYRASERAWLCHRSDARSFCDTLPNRKTLARSACACAVRLHHFRQYLSLGRMETGEGGGVIIEIDSRGVGCQISLMERDLMWRPERSEVIQSRILRFLFRTLSRWPLR